MEGKQQQEKEEEEKNKTKKKKGKRGSVEQHAGRNEEKRRK